MMTETNSRARPRLAGSAGLLGQPVRHDGSRRRDGFVLDTLARHADLVPAGALAAR